jgi:hypothetical protein
MPINVTAAGAAGTHSFAKTNVNTAEDYIFYKNTGGDVIPAAYSTGRSFIYSAGAGSLTGVTTGDLVYVIASGNVRQLKFSASSGGAALNLTGSTGGSVKFNTPTIYDNKLNIDGSFTNNQAVKYYTTGTPMTGLVSGNTYFLRNVSISSFAGAQSLYTLTSNTHTFTSGGVTGRVGPDLATLRASYTTAAAWRDTYLQQGNFQGYQDWTVPVSGIYEFDARGASGFDGAGAGGVGRGAIVKGRVSLTKGEIITIVCGQIGTAPTSGTAGGSGGGTFVVRKAGNVPLFVAGGGSAESNSGAGRDGVTTNLGGTSTSGQTAGGASSFGGRSTGGFSAGGAGFNGAGQDGISGGGNNAGGGTYATGLFHNSNARVGGFGGFGGAGQSDGTTLVQSGGAGGYSGGGGARSTTNFHSGGGGGSFITAEANTVSTSNGQYNASSSFNGVAITNLSAFHTGNGTVIMSLVSSFTAGNELYPTALDAENGTNKILIASAGNSYHALTPITLDAQNDLIHTAAGHGLSNGQAVTYLFNGTTPAGLTNNTTYYINTVNNYTYRISLTPSPTFQTVNLTTPSARSTGVSDVVRGVVVNTALDTLTISNHGFQVDQPIQYDAGGGTPISPLQDQTTYFVAEVIDANNIRLKISLNALTYINFTAPGTSTTNSFIFVTVNLLNDELYLPNHGLSNGQAVRYSNGGGTNIGGLTNNTTYFVIKRDNSIIRLAATAAAAQPGAQVAVNLTSTPVSGTHTLTVTALDFTTDTFTIPSHGFLQGELVQYDSQGQTAITGLTTATPYYIIFVNGDNIKLATTPENAIAGTAVNIIASPAGVGTHKLTSLSKTPDGTYDIATVPSATSFTAIARGTVPTIVKTFNPRSTVDLNLETFKIPSHGFLTGTAVTYSDGGDTAISGLTDATVYYVVAVNRDYLKLSTTASNAESGITLSVDDFGTGATHSFTTTQINGNVTGGGNVTIASGSVLVNGSGTSFSKVLKVGDPFRLFPPNTTISRNFAPADVNTTNNRITIVSHGFSTGDSIVFSAGGGVAPSPLIDQYYYFVRAVSASEITLHGSAADATGNTSVVAFSTQGTAGASPFNVTRTTPVNPIIRKITAIGSDLQLSVDRPYSTAYTAQSYSYPTFVYVRPQGYALHRPFDGGVEMSTGAQISLGVIVRQTRKYFRYQSGKGIQTSCGINFQPSIDIDSMVRTTATTVTVTTRRPHGLISGLFVRISQAEDSFGVTSTRYNGDFQVTVPTGSLTTFVINAATLVGAEAKSYGFPQFFVREWTGGAVRSGMFDFQNGMFYEFDGQKIYACRRSSTQQMAGTISALNGSEVVFGTGTNFTGQVHVGDYVVLRGQSYRVAEITSDTQMSIRPEYKGASGTEREFNPGNGTTGVVKLSTDRFDIVSHGFSQNLPLVYNSIDGEVIGGLINGRAYYCDIIDNNAFKLMANPNTPGTNVELSSVGTTAVHSFTPAKSGIIATLTVDVKVPQEDWNIDPCDGTGVTGYDLNLSRIQMAYIDYSWYGAGKIRFGFKTTDGQVKYVHEFVHNNILYESYLRSGNLPARYEVVTYDNPTYIPYLFHWGTSVIMDGRYDSDRAYLFTATGQTLNVPGTTRKTFASTGINLATDLLTVQTHGFNNGDIVQFQSIAATGAKGANAQNPATSVVGSNTLANLTNNASYKILVNSANLIHLLPVAATISLGATQAITSAQSGNLVTITTTNPHGIVTGMPVGSYFGRVPTGVYTATRVSDTVFTYNAATSATVASAADPNIAVTEVINLTSQGSTQFTYFLFPDGSVNNSSGPNYQPLLSIRLSPSVSSGLTGKLGDRDVINRMQLRLQEIGISSTQLVDVKLLLNARLNNLNFVGVTSPSLCQIVEHTAADTVSGGVQVYNFRASGGSGVGIEGTTSVSIGDLFELSNSILGGDSVFPDGPDILTVAVSRLVGGTTLTSAKLSWTEAQA